jgi:hypothetical protein
MRIVRHGRSAADANPLQLGTMTFKVNTDEMELETTWNKLQIPRFSELERPSTLLP